ncbi:hypothetical protein [Parvularcula sp. LCG005]|uniref:hypothetical protein n=1 Tax=Parvularcula sp. LCG005 TaxID=3078805 RepID=UPI002942178D|nr:hypothetical protein [Parvularcula sp. LCG005]WOI54756.1 hypothetical protein RUI03_07060 [Parvularcula sp. LCG005]
MTKPVSLLAVGCAILLPACQPEDPSTAPEKSATEATENRPRIINMTDLGADPDDEQSMVRQLVMAN